MASVSSTREDYLIVAINAGHGGSDSGATGYGLQEKDLNLSIARSMKDELDTYTGVTAYMVRDDDSYVGLQERVDLAKEHGADVFVSIHINSGGGTGAEVWVPNDSSYNYEAHTVGVSLGGKIAQQLAALGLTLRGNEEGVAGLKVRDSESGNTYGDGSTADFYSDIYRSRLAGFPGIIVEHAFIDRWEDASRLADSSFQRSLGVLLYGIGAVLAIVLNACKIPALAFALGMFIPLELNVPLVVGGAVNWYVTSRSKDAALNAERGEKGTLLASGFIAGGALMGVVSAAMRFGGVNMVNDAWLSNTWSEVLALGAYAILIFYLVKASMKTK